MGSLRTTTKKTTTTKTTVEVYVAPEEPPSTEPEIEPNVEAIEALFAELSSFLERQQNAAKTGRRIFISVLAALALFADIVTIEGSFIANLILSILP